MGAFSVVMPVLWSRGLRFGFLTTIFIPANLMPGLSPVVLAAGVVTGVVDWWLLSILQDG